MGKEKSLKELQQQLQEHIENEDNNKDVDLCILAKKIAQQAIKVNQSPQSLCDLITDQNNTANYQAILPSLQTNEASQKTTTISYRSHLSCWK